MNAQDNNVIDLCAYRRLRFPTHNEIMSHLAFLRETATGTTEKEVAVALSEMYVTGVLAVTRDESGAFLFELRE